MRSEAYWKRRFELLEASQHQKAENYYEALESVYRQTHRELEHELTHWYQRLADNNQVSLADARKMLDEAALDEFRWDVKTYIKRGEEMALNGKWMKELENASARVHISWLDAEKVRIKQKVLELYKTQHEGVRGLLQDTVKDGYYHSAFEIQRGLGTGTSIRRIEESHLDRILSRPWGADNKTFSSRIWTQQDKLLNTLQTQLTKALVRGDDVQKVINTLRDQFGVAERRARTLVNTESAFFSAVARGECYDELGVEKYKVYATLDGKTSATCQEMDGKVFFRSEYQPGVTAEPFHTNCRTTTAPYFENMKSTRAARGADGKTYQVPSDMTYPEWYKKHIAA